MIPTDFPQSTGVLAAPPGWDEETNGVCEPLPYMRQGPMLVSMWLPDSDELARLNAGLPVVLGIMQPTHPVVCMTVADEMTEEQINELKQRDQGAG